MKYKHSCNIANAPKFADWIANRGGIAVWQSVNLSNPGASWSTPATIRKGDCHTGPGQEYRDTALDADDIVPYPKPTWQAGNEPTVITDPAEVEVYESKEVKRFRVGVRMGSQGFTLKVTDGGTRRIREAVAKAGEGAFHGFDYDTQEAIIYAATTIGSLKEWIEKNQ